ncbi:hypothetical protein Tco_0127096 [Tanacetum coccineum]
MVAYLKKLEGSEGFHQRVDFLNTSHIRYALTENPTIYVSLIQQFWNTATAKTLDNGEIELTATIDGKVKIVTKASVRRHLKLEDSDGISSLPTTKIFEQLSLMGHLSTSDKLTFQKGHFSPQWRFLIYTILHCLSPKKTSWEQFSSNIATAIICLATNRKFNFSKLIFDGMVKNLDSKHKFLMYPRFIQVFLSKHKRLLQPHTRTYIAPTHTSKIFSNKMRVSKDYTEEDIPLFPTMIVQGPVVQGEGSTYLVESHHIPTNAPSTSQPPISSPSRRTTRQEYVVPQPRSPTQTLVVDEAASIGVDVRYGGDTTIVTSLEAGQGSGNIDKTPTMPHDSPLLRVNTLGSDEGSMTLEELMVFCTNLSKKVESLETDLKQTKKIYGAAYIKLIMKGRYGHGMEFESNFDAAKEVFTANLDVSTANLDVSTAEPVSTTGAAITTASVAISTARPTVSTADDITMDETLVYIKRSSSKDKAVRLQDELEEEERQRIARVHEEASSFNVEEWEYIQARVEVDEELAQRIQVEEREKYTEAEQARMLVELINQRKKYFVAQRAEERRKKPPTQAQQRTYMSNYIKHMGSHTLQQLRCYFFDELKTLFETTMRRVNTFVPIESEVNRAVPELAAESLKRSAEEELDQESSKRQKTGESSESRDKENDELSQEELQQMMIIVPEQGMNVEALQTKYLIIDWEIYIEGTRNASCVYREGNRHLHAGRESVSIVKRNSYIDAGSKTLGGTG